MAAVFLYLFTYANIHRQFPSGPLRTKLIFIWKQGDTEQRFWALESSRPNSSPALTHQW